MLPIIPYRSIYANLHSPRTGKILPVVVTMLIFSFPSGSVQYHIEPGIVACGFLKLPWSINFFFT